MSFTSVWLYAFVGAAAAGNYLCPRRWRTVYLLMVSYGLYASLAPQFVPLLAAMSAVAYGCGNRIASASSESQKRVILFAGVSVQVAAICVFKSAQALQGALIPLGLSYYSFKLIAYLADVYWDETLVQREPVRFLLYPAFFAQIPGGPIQRPGDFWSQFPQEGPAEAGYGRIVAGVKLILLGLMLKLVIGDRLGAFAGVVDKAPEQYRWYIILLVTACYPLQLFADFAGYTNIAIGIAKLFGINSPPNFNAPFAASNMLEFWRRWHMTLTSWMADYVFIPVNMALRRYGKFALAVSVTLTMTLIGVWHGFTVNFLIFGLLHSAIVLMTRVTQAFRDRIFVGRPAMHLRRWGGIFATWLLIMLPQIFWHKPDLTGALAHIRLLFGLDPAGTLGISDIATEISEPVLICALISLYAGAGSPGLRRASDLLGWRRVPDWAVCGFALFTISSLTPETASHFIYGQF